MLGVTVRYLTPHNKWSIHSEYQDNLFMLSLSRGGQAIWISDIDAAKVGIEDNDWIEAVNRNGDGRSAGDRVPPDARGHRLHASRAGSADRRTAHGDDGQARRHPQLADPDHAQAERTSSAATRNCPSRSTTSAPRATSATRSR